MKSGLRSRAKSAREAPFNPLRRGILQRKCSCDSRPGPTGECPECRRERKLGQRRHLPPKLTINQPGDRYEQEADRVADQVMRMPDPRLRRQSTPHAGQDVLPLPKLKVQRQVDAEMGTTVPPLVYEVLRKPGQPLDPATLAFMEPRFGHDFSQVRVHADAKAAESARAVHAQAFTVGLDVVFGAGQYAPGTDAGKRLLAHELSHTIQQATPEGKSKADKGHSNKSRRVHEPGNFGKAGQVPERDASDAVHTTSSNLVQRQEPVTTITFGAIAAKCALGAIIGALFDTAIQAISQSIQKNTWRFWKASLNYCSIILSAVLGCIAAPISAFALNAWVTAKLGARLGGIAGPILGRILLFIAKKLAIAVPKFVVSKLAKLGCLSPEQAKELGVIRGKEEDGVHCKPKYLGGGAFLGEDCIIRQGTGGPNK